MHIALTVDLARFQSQDLDRAHQVVLQVTTLKAEELNVYLVQQDLIMVLLGGHRYLFVSLAVLCNIPYLVLQAVQATCPAGSYVSSTPSQCSLCPAGTANPSATTSPTACSPCPVGQFSGVGSSGCTSCPAGIIC